MAVVSQERFRCMIYNLQGSGCSTVDLYTNSAVMYQDDLSICLTLVIYSKTPWQKTATFTTKMALKMRSLWWQVQFNKYIEMKVLPEI